MFNPCFSQTANYEAANWKRWLLDNPQEIQMAPPDFESEMKDLKNLQQTFKTASLAYYWADNGGYDFWSDMAGQKMFEYRIMDDATAVARIYTVLQTAYHEYFFPADAKQFQKLAQDCADSRFYTGIHFVQIMKLDS